MLRICLAIAGLALAVSVAFAANFAPFQAFITRSNVGCNCWTEVPIGGGGVFDGVSIATDGTKLFRTDTAGLWLQAPGASTATQVINASSMPAATVSYKNTGGVYAAGIAPQNSNYMWAIPLDGFLYYSSNKGTTWTKSSRAEDLNAPNNTAPWKSFDPRIAADPSNAVPQVVWITSTEAISVSNDAGATTSDVSTSTIPAASPALGGYVVCYDTSGGALAGKTINLFIGSYGNGFYFTNNAYNGASATFTNITGSGPTTFQHARCDSNGKFYVVDNASPANVWVYSGGAGGTWTKILAGSGGATNFSAPLDVAIDPSNHSRIITINSGTPVNGNGTIVNISSDGGSTWTFGDCTVGQCGSAGITTSCAATDVPWLVNDCGAVAFAFDPSVSNTVWVSGNAGIFTANPNTTSFNWTSNTLAAQNLTTSWIIAPTNGFPIFIAWDLAAWTVQNITQQQSTYGPVADFNVVRGFSADWSGQLPSTVAALVDNQSCVAPINSGYSTNKGVAWTKFTHNEYCTTNSTAGGCIAVSADPSGQHMLVLPYDAGTNPNGPWTTTNAASTAWTAQTVGGSVPSSGTTGWGGAIFNRNQHCAADKVTADTYYISNDGQGNAAAMGFYKSADGGVTWTHTNNGSTCNPSGGQPTNDHLVAVPGQSGNIFWARGDTGIYPDPNSLFCYSQDGGSTWTVISSTETAVAFGFGQAAPGHTYPTVWFIGWYNDGSGIKYGLWRSIDWDGSKTFQCQGTCSNTGTSNGFALNVFDFITAVSGDPADYHRAYAALGGMGFAYWESSN